MDRDLAKLRGISRDLSQLGIELTNRVDPPDQRLLESVGEAFVAISKAISNITGALERGAEKLAEKDPSQGDRAV